MANWVPISAQPGFRALVRLYCSHLGMQEDPNADALCATVAHSTGIPGAHGHYINTEVHNRNSHADAHLNHELHSRKFRRGKGSWKSYVLRNKYVIRCEVWCVCVLNWADKLAALPLASGKCFKTGQNREFLFANTINHFLFQPQKYL